MKGSYTQKYNIKGCADLLKSNLQFNSLTKQMYVKYKVLSNVPVEYQIVLIVATTAYIAKSKNDMNNITDFLNQPVEEPVNEEQQI